MTIKEQLMNDMKEAMRAHDALRLQTVRFLKAEIQNFEIDNGEVNDEAAQKVIASQVKKSKDAIIDFKNAGRDDLVKEEEAKIKVMEAYLPKQLDDAQLTEIVKATLTEVGAANQGQLIGAVMKKVAGQADGGRVSAMVQKCLNN
ncbi:MAG: GatB/YqeY domain-containing protein [bacterium]|nr:GatB/YqeY domain-containing protein [bacterium]